MKKLVLVLLLSITWIGSSQETYTLEMEYNQVIQGPTGAMGNHINLPKNKVTIVMGGLNDLDGLNNYFNVFGSKLIVDRLDIGTDGIKRVVLRREDGKDFFNLLPTISAKLIPVHQTTIDVASE